MKRLTIAALCFVMFLGTASAAFGFDCFCIGRNNAVGGGCGNGSDGVAYMSGAQFYYKKGIGEQWPYLYMEEVKREEFKSGRPIYSPQSGWYCWPYER